MEQTLTRIAASVAMALSDEEVRTEVYSALQTSPYPEGKLHFSTFLSAHGDGVGRAAGASKSALLAMLDSVVDLEFYMPVDAHRSQWHGGDNLIVATALDDDGTAPVGFDLRGKRVVLSSSVPPTTPTLVLVPVETDFSAPPVPYASSLQAVQGAVEGTYLKYLRIDNPEDYEGWAMGDPEFEIHSYTQQPDGTYVDVSCSGEQQDVPKYFHYDGDPPSWSGTVLLTTKSLAEVGHTQLQVWEDDADPCTATGGRPVRTNALSEEDLFALGKLGGAAVAVSKAFQDTSSMAWVYRIAATSTALGALYQTLDGVHKDDHVGVIQWPPNKCWAEATGSLSASVRNPITGKTGYAVVDVNYGNREPLCALSVDLIGPTEVETCPTWPAPDPEPIYFAAVSGGSGTISYEWYEDGVYVGNGSSYDLSTLEAGQHSLEVRVTRGAEAGGESLIVNVTELDIMSCDGMPF